jgi:hypothetical protein
MQAGSFARHNDSNVRLVKSSLEKEKNKDGCKC